MEKVSSPPQPKEIDPNKRADAIRNAVGFYIEKISADDTHSACKEIYAQMLGDIIELPDTLIFFVDTNKGSGELTGLDQLEGGRLGACLKVEDGDENMTIPLAELSLDNLTVKIIKPVSASS